MEKYSVQGHQANKYQSKNWKPSLSYSKAQILSAVSPLPLRMQWEDFTELEPTQGGLFPKMLQGKEGQVQVKLAPQEDFVSSPYWERISSPEELSPLRNRHLDLPPRGKYVLGVKTCYLRSQLQLAFILSLSLLFKTRRGWGSPELCHQEKITSLPLVLSFAFNRKSPSLVSVGNRQRWGQTERKFLHFIRSPQTRGKRCFSSTPGPRASPLLATSPPPAQPPQNRLRVKIFPFNFIFHHFYPFWMVHI